jgi:hypothetical protein
VRGENISTVLLRYLSKGMEALYNHGAKRAKEFMWSDQVTFVAKAFFSFSHYCNVCP